MRGITERILRAAGYSVLSAPGGGAALSLCAGYAGKVDLLLTDVIMPQMSGPDLATALIARLPQLKVLYMSGYTDTMIVRHGALAPGTNFLSKPFSAGDLTRRVREVLDNAQAIGRRTAQ